MVPERPVMRLAVRSWGNPGFAEHLVDDVLIPK